MWPTYIWVMVLCGLVWILCQVSYTHGVRDGKEIQQRRQERKGKGWIA